MLAELWTFSIFLTLAAAHLRNLQNNLLASDLVATAFSAYNEDAEVLQTGVLIRLKDDTFYFNDSTLGLDCREGYIRPVVLNRVKTELIPHSQPPAYQTEVIMRNVTILYKDCRVSKRSPEFQDADESTPCFLSVDIEFLIGWVILATGRQKSELDTDQEKNGTSCQYYLDLDLETHKNLIGVGMMELFFLPTSTLHTFPLSFEGVWTRKVSEAVKRMSLIFLAGVPCQADVETTNS